MGLSACLGYDKAVGEGRCPAQGQKDLEFGFGYGGDNAEKIPWCPVVEFILTSQVPSKSCLVHVSLFVANE